MTNIRDVFWVIMGDTMGDKMDENEAETEIETDSITDEIYRCLRRYHPIKNTQEFLMLIAMVLLSTGLVAICIGYVIPREYVFDPSLPAREMEKIELHFRELSFYLDVCILSGMGCIAAGGLIVTSVTMYAIFIERPRIYRAKDRQDLCLLDNATTEMVTYGTASTSVE